MKILTYSSATPGYDSIPHRIICYHATDRLEARRNKILTPRFNEYDYSIWIDGNLNLNCQPKDMVDKFLADADLAVFKHPDRDCCYEEAYSLSKLEYGEYNLDKYKKQLKAGKGLCETSLLVRRHNKKIDDFNSCWWQELKSVGERDQLTFMYSLFKHKVKYCLIDGCRQSSSLVTYKPHLKSKTTITWGDE